MQQTQSAGPVRTAHMSVMLTVNIVSHNPLTAVTEDTREMVFLVQRLSIALQRRNAVSFLATFHAV